MLTAKLPKTTIVNVETNMFWDGRVHAMTWTMTVVGLVLLWRAVVKHRVLLSTKCLVGSMLMGYGVFNFVEGLIDHHILHLHHVAETLGVSVYDYAFLASGVIMFWAGWSMVASGKKDEQLLTGGDGRSISLKFRESTLESWHSPPEKIRG